MCFLRVSCVHHLYLRDFKASAGLIRADMAFVYLSDLKGDEEDWVIRVRVCRMWESISTKDGSLISVDMILADEKVCKISAFVLPLLHCDLSLLFCL